MGLDTSGLKKMAYYIFRSDFFLNQLPLFMRHTKWYGYQKIESKMLKERYTRKILNKK